MGIANWLRLHAIGVGRYDRFGMLFCDLQQCSAKSENRLINVEHRGTKACSSCCGQDVLSASTRVDKGCLGACAFFNNSLDLQDIRWLATLRFGSFGNRMSNPFGNTWRYRFSNNSLFG